MLQSLELERFTLSLILKNPVVLADFSSYIGEQDYTNKFHKLLFSLLRKSINQGDKPDKLLLSEHIKNLNISLDSGLEPYDYIEALSNISIDEKNSKKLFEELHKLTVSRDICEIADRIKKTVTNSKEKTVQEILALADAIYFERINLSDIPEIENLLEDLQSIVENNKITEEFLLGPHPTLNDLYGSLLRAGNISTICARSGSFKSTFLLDYAYKTAEKYNIPVAHFDNGELTNFEIRMRLVAGLSGVPIHYIENGEYKKYPEMLKAITPIWERVKKQKYYYYSVGGKNTEDMVSALRRFYWAKVGKGGKMIFVYDYFKSYNDFNSNKSEWEMMGKIVTKFKDCITSEIPVGMLAAVQSNRSGIVTGKTEDQIVTDESIISGGDRIVHYSSHVFVLKKKTLDTLDREHNQFGNCELVNIKARHLGKNVKRALTPVKLPNGKSKSNYLHLDISNFAVAEKGDLCGTVDKLSQLNISEKTQEKSELL